MFWSGQLVSSGTQSMLFLLSHTIFSQLEFEVTTDHYMSNITWKRCNTTYFQKKFQSNKRFIASIKLAPIHFKKQRSRSLLISWTLTTTYLSFQEADKMLSQSSGTSICWYYTTAILINQSEEFHPQPEHTIQWPVWLTWGSSLQSCSMLAQKRMFRLQGQIHLFRAHVWFRLWRTTENAYELCDNFYFLF